MIPHSHPLFLWQENNNSHTPESLNILKNVNISVKHKFPLFFIDCERLLRGHALLTWRCLHRDEEIVIEVSVDLSRVGRL